jgi:hypothetical protein
MAVISTSTFDPLHRYIAVRLQQGVPIVDADVNELDDIRGFELRAFVKWFVGDGVPEGNDGFRIAANDVDNDIAIKAGAPAAPAGSTNLTIGLGHVGRVFVDGRDALLAADTTLRDQRLHTSHATAAGLASDWGVATVTDLPPGDATVLVYLDLWDRLVTPNEEPALIFAGLGTESAARMQRQWVVRWTTNATVPQAGQAMFVAGHSYTPLASIVRRAAQPKVRDADITDLRQRRLLVPPATLIQDVLGLDPQAYRQGTGRPPVSMRDAVNALLRGEMPATPEQPIAPNPASDDMSFAFDLIGNDVVGFWHSGRDGGVNQIFGVQWPQAQPQLAATNPVTQITTGVGHRLPSAQQLPGGDLLVAYETLIRDIHFRRAPQLSGLGTAAETSVAVDPAVLERHPLLLRAGNQLVFLWHSAGSPDHWTFRLRQYTAAWDEAAATWGAATTLTHDVVPAAPSTVASDVHATVANGLVYVAFRAGAVPENIAVLRLDPASSLVENWGNKVLSSSGALADTQPFLLADGTTSVWAFWRGADQGLFHQRFDVATNTWVGTESAVPGTDAPGAADDSRTAAVRDASGAIWLFWVSTRTSGGTDHDVWVVRRDPVSGLWGAPRPVVAALGDDDLPFARIGPDATIWLFWRSNRAGGQFDLYYKRLITVI